MQSEYSQVIAVIWFYLNIHVTDQNLIIFWYSKYLKLFERVRCDSDEMKSNLRRLRWDENNIFMNATNDVRRAYIRVLWNGPGIRSLWFWYLDGLLDVTIGN